MALSTSPQALLWDAFRTNPSSDEDLFLPDTHIVFLPTGAGAAGEPQVRDFFKAGGFSHAKKMAVEEKVIHRTVGESSAVDEVEVTVKFVSGAGGWLLPGIQPHHLEDLTITFPLMVCGSIVEDRIASVRYLWDNASVLKMVRLIGSRHSWPIVAETQVDALRSPSRFRLNPFGNATSGSGARAQISNISNIFSPPVSPPHVTAAQQQQQAAKKGHPALTSQIFSQQPHHQQQQTTSPASAGHSGKKGHPALTSTLFDHLKSAPQEEQSQHQNNSRLPLSPSTSEESLASKASSPTSSHNHNHNNVVSAKKGHPALTSTLFNHLKDPRQQQQEQPAARATRQEPQQEVEEERAAGWRSDYVRPKGHPALTSTLFSQPPPPPNPALSRPYKKTSHNIFGPPPVEKVAAVPVVAEEYVLEPSALEAELVRNEEQQQELKDSIVSPSELTTEDLEKQVLELEKLKVQEELYQAQKLQQEQEAQKKVEEPVVEPTPVPAPAPAPAPARKIHPNYRSSFTIGGPR